MNPKNRMYALGRKKAGKMNKTELSFEQWLKNNPEIVWYSFEGMKFKIGDKCFYTPDFMALTQYQSLIAYEVKGYWMDDARVKIKAAADKFPVRFIGVQWKKKKWEFESFSD